MTNPDAPGEGQPESGQQYSESTDKNSVIKEIAERAMNVPGRSFEGFNAAAVVMVHGYKELGKEARMQVYEIVNRETNKLGDKALQYYLDDSNGIRFARGNLYRLTRTEKRETARLLLSAPLSILKVVKTDTEMKIAYEFAGQLSTATVKDLVTHVSVNMKSTRDANKTLAELLYKYAKDQENKGQIETEHDSIYIDSGIVKVSYNTNLIDIKRTLKSLREFWPMSANPHAFISGLAYNLVAPLAYHIRTNSPPGYLFPIRISFGRTGGAKTSTDAIFVIKGFDQDKDAGFLTNEQVSTPFTFEKNMADSTLPVIINDVSPDWLFRVSTILKNSSENPTAGDRGNPDQSITRRRIKRALNITSNEAIVPSDDAARARRYILEEYTEEHVKRRNPYAFQNFMDSLTSGFMFTLFKKIFEGKKLKDVVSEVAQTESGYALVDYVLKRLNELCDAHGVDPFPKYERNRDSIPDSFTELVEWLRSQWFRLNDATDESGRGKPPYPEISKYEIDVDETSNFVVYWFTGAAYKVARRRLDLPHKTVTSLFSNYTESRDIQIAATNKFHKFSGVAGRGFALRVNKSEVIS